MARIHHGRLGPPGMAAGDAALCSSRRFAFLSGPRPLGNRAAPPPQPELHAESVRSKLSPPNKCFALTIRYLRPVMMGLLPNGSQNAPPQFRCTQLGSRAAPPVKVMSRAQGPILHADGRLRRAKWIWVVVIRTRGSHSVLKCVTEWPQRRPPASWSASGWSTANGTRRHRRRGGRTCGNTRWQLFPA